MIADMLLMSSLGVCGRCRGREDDGSESKLGNEGGVFKRRMAHQQSD